jgi:hypothetical protein
MEGSKKVTQKFCEKPHGRLPLGLKRRWKDDIKMEVEEIGY